MSSLCSVQREQCSVLSARHRKPGIALESSSMNCKGPLQLINTVGERSDKTGTCRSGASRNGRTHLSSSRLLACSLLLQGSLGQLSSPAACTAKGPCSWRTPSGSACGRAVMLWLSLCSAACPNACKAIHVSKLGHGVWYKAGKAKECMLAPALLPNIFSLPAWALHAAE